MGPCSISNNFMPVKEGCITTILLDRYGARFITGHVDESPVSGNGCKGRVSGIIPEAGAVHVQVHSTSGAVPGPGSITVQMGSHCAAGQVIAGPGSSIPHVQFYMAIGGSVGVINISFEIGILCIEANVHFGPCAAEIHTTAEENIPFDGRIIGSGTGHMTILVFQDIHIDHGLVAASEFSISTNCIGCPIHCFDGAAANIHFGSHGTHCFTRTVISIGKDIHQSINSNSRLYSIHTVHGLDYRHIGTIDSLRPEGKHFIFRITATIVNSYGTSIIHKDSRCLSANRTFRLHRNLSCISHIYDALSNGGNSCSMGIACGINVQVVAMKVNIRLVSLSAPGNGCTDLRHPSAATNQCLANGDRCGRLCEGIIMGTIFQDAGLHIDLIHRRIPGDGFAIAVSGLGVRIGQMVIIVPFSSRGAFLAAVIPGNIAACQRFCHRSCRKSLSNADFACQVLVRISCINKLVCQFIQCIINQILICVNSRVQIQSGPISYQRHGRTCFRIGNLEAATGDRGRFISIKACIISGGIIYNFMLINNHGAATIVIYTDIAGIILVDNTSISCAIAAHQFSQVTSTE